MAPLAGAFLPRLQPEPSCQQEKNMGQRIESSFVCDGRYRAHRIDAVGRQLARIIEIEEVDTRERHYGSPRHVRQLLTKLCHSDVEENSLSA
jgi:hypothetical protein